MSEAAFKGQLAKSWYCTAFDSGYLARGLAMVGSLREVGDLSTIVILCLDDDCHEYLQELALPEVELMSLSGLEATTAGLVDVRSERSKGEYIFTCIPALVLNTLLRIEEGECIAYLDADTYFYADPRRDLFGAVAGDGAAVGLTSHRFPEQLKHLRRYGDFNAGCVVFRNCLVGRDAARWWVTACLQWCSDYPDHGRYANQGYLDELAHRSGGVVVLSAVGLNVAPWNLAGTTIHKLHSGYCLEDGSPLVFFHFHGLRQRGDWMYTGLRAFKVSPDPTLINDLYAPYIERLQSIRQGRAGINTGRPTPLTNALVGTRRSRGLRTFVRRVRGRYIQGIERLRGESIRLGESDDVVENRDSAVCQFGDLPSRRGRLE